MFLATLRGKIRKIVHPGGPRVVNASATRWFGWGACYLSYILGGVIEVTSGPKVEFGTHRSPEGMGIET